MGLISCVDCGKMVSDRAQACPTCGGPIEVQPLASESKNESASSMRKEADERPLEASNQNTDIDENSVEMDNADVILVDAGREAIQVIAVVRELTSLGLREARDLVDGAPMPILVGASREEAEHAKSKLEEAGATVELTGSDHLAEIARDKPEGTGATAELVGFDHLTENQKRAVLDLPAAQREKTVESFLRQNSQRNSAKTKNGKSNKNGGAFVTWLKKVPIWGWVLLGVAAVYLLLFSVEIAQEGYVIGLLGAIFGGLIVTAVLCILVIHYANEGEKAYRALPDVETSNGKVRPPRPPWAPANKQQKCDRCDWRGAVFQGKSRRWQDNTKEGTVFGTAAWVYQTPFMCWNCKHQWSEQTGSRFGI